MIKEFFQKKETLLILIIAICSLFFVILGFLFLFFKTDTEPRIIPSTVEDIKWNDFSSKILKQKIQYPEYMYILEEENNLGNFITIADFKPQNQLTYLNNQNNISLYPSGFDMEFYYGKTRDSEFNSKTGQKFKKIEYLTLKDDVWAIMLIPQNVSNKLWQSRGFIWMQAQIQNREIMCMSSTGVLISDIECDPFAGQKIIYSGVVTSKFLDTGYEIINKNNF